ncbi:MAG TPA: hypothetical protein VKS21_05550 [Spirochaetota bacterium]|nr:hypothetical protein [Spirochaetota bacterium]
MLLFRTTILLFFTVLTYVNLISLSTSPLISVRGSAYSAAQAGSGSGDHRGAAFYLNPAVLPHTEKFSLALHYYNNPGLFKNRSGDITVSFTRLAAACNIEHLSYSQLKIIKNYNYQKNIKPAHLKIKLYSAGKINNILSLGGSGGLFYYKLNDKNHTLSLLLDTGIILHNFISADNIFSSLSAGLSLRNLGFTLKKKNTDINLPYCIQTGICWHIPLRVTPDRLWNLKLNLDIIPFSADGFSLRSGIQARFIIPQKGKVILSTGYEYKPYQPAAQGLHAGLSLVINSLKISYALSRKGLAGFIHNFSTRLYFRTGRDQKKF